MIENWVERILADPITKKPCTKENFNKIENIIDARVFLKNSLGYANWEEGQLFYEDWEVNSKGYNQKLVSYQEEIDKDKPVYDYFKIYGTILDVGGGVGTVREFLSDKVKFISVDTFLEAPLTIPKPKKEVYKCLNKNLNFLASNAEFLPFLDESFNWVHMRSVLDHFQVPDLALIEAHRVLEKNGHILIGLYVLGGKKEIPTLKERVKELLEFLGFSKFKDHHTWHPTLSNLKKLIIDNKFIIKDVYWQPGWNNSVVYIKAKKNK